MGKKLKKELNAVFSAPPPERKAAFLKVHRRRELSSRALLLTQAGYVRWWTWAGSAGLFAGILWMAGGQEAETVWASSSLTPLLALLMVTESSRSRRYGMEELELVCRMPLRTALLARMTAIGLLHLLLLGIAVPVLALVANAGTLRAGAYLLTPYLLTASLGMELSRRVRGQEGLLACAAAAFLVCALGMCARRTWPEIYHVGNVPIWWAALALTLAASAFEFVKTVKETEELQWS